MKQTMGLVANRFTSSIPILEKALERAAHEVVEFFVAAVIVEASMKGFSFIARTSAGVNLAGEPVLNVTGQVSPTQAFEANYAFEPASQSSRQKITGRLILKRVRGTCRKAELKRKSLPLFVGSVQLLNAGGRTMALSDLVF